MKSARLVSFTGRHVWPEAREQIYANAAFLAPPLPITLPRRQDDEGQSAEVAPASSFVHSFANPRCSVKVAELTNSDRAQHDFWWTVRRRRWLGRSEQDVNRIVSCAAGMVRPRGGLRSPRPYSLKEVLVEMADMLGPR